MSVRRYLAQTAKLLLDGSVLGGAFGLASLIRFEGILPSHLVQAMEFTLPLVVLTQLSCLAANGARRSSWRHVSLLEALHVCAAMGVAGVIVLTWRWAVAPLLDHLSLLRLDGLPIGVILIDVPLSVLALLGIRVGSRLWSESRWHNRRLVGKPGSVPTLLIGAGRAGVQVAREIAARPELGISPVGFLDDDPTLLGLVISGLPVLGTTTQFPDIAKRYGVRQTLITIANRPQEAVRRVASLCKQAAIIAKIIPPLHEIVGGSINLSRIRDVAIEDVLRRQPIHLESAPIAAALRGRTIMITGAGGSIGAELCREVCRFGAATLILVEQAENSLFQNHRQLLCEFPEQDLVPCIADICDTVRMEQIFSRYKPVAVFHAAAHKHVPLMECNPGEAVKNNVLGTATLAQLAHAHRVERFVMISTDKAVNPTSVMGVSKRVAELYIQAFSQRSQTRFVAVRFGNVLGSNGSVVPIFKEQIASGGPITVTHPDMKRYFMTISEACQLVLQAASMGKGGEIFILDMGEPVFIVDLARDLIRLSGLTPDKDVEIRFTNIRPGEKLFEELFLSEESAVKTYHPRVFIGRLTAPAWPVISRQVKELGEIGVTADARKLQAKFKEIVPEYDYRDLRQDQPPVPTLNAPHEVRALAPSVEVGGIALNTDPV